MEDSLWKIWSDMVLHKFLFHKLGPFSNTLNHFIPLIFFYTHWKQQKNTETSSMKWVSHRLWNLQNRYETIRKPSQETNLTILLQTIPLYFLIIFMINMKQNKETNLIEDNQNRINKDKNYNLMDPTKFDKFDRC